MQKEMSEQKKKGPQIGLSAEEWIKCWETDFADFTPEEGHEHHEDLGHGECKGEDGEEERGCGSQKYLKKHLSKLTHDKPCISILVSLCGDSSDVAFLADKGHAVTGIDVSEKAVKSIFTQHKPPIPYSVTETSPFKVYTATDHRKITIYVGDFFDPFPSDVAPFDAIWDGHGIVAIPEKDMQPYATKLASILKPDGAILISSIWYDIAELTSGPVPAPLSTAQFKKFFPDCSVELLENGDFQTSGFPGIKKCTNDINIVKKNQ